MLGGIVRGKLTTLRVPTEDDLPHVNAWMADMRVRRGGHVWDEPAMLATWKERLKETAKDQHVVLWTIEAEARAIGTVLVESGWRQSPSAHIRCFVMGPDAWHRGFGADAARSLHRYFFDYLDKKWSTLTVPADNTPGLRIAERLGYREFGRGHAVYFRDGSYTDELSLRFDRETWNERWAATEREYAALPEGIER